jgi:hypothetical protein
VPRPFLDKISIARWGEFVKGWLEKGWKVGKNGGIYGFWGKKIQNIFIKLQIILNKPLTMYE